MTQIWQGDEVVAVTAVEAGPCTVAQVKTKERDGYEAVQLGYGTKKEKNMGKAARGHLSGLGNLRYLREFRPESTGGLKRGDMIDSGTFAAGDKVQVTGTSKGKGFQGVVKRHGFAGSQKTHGNKDQLRMPGSIGATGPAHVFKGTRMPGQMGNERVTVTNLEIVEVDAEKGVLYVKGAIPGAINGLILVSGPGELKIKSAEVPSAAEEPATEEAPKEEVPKAEEKKEPDKAAATDKKEEVPAKKPVAEKTDEKKEETPEEVEKEVVEAKEKADAKAGSK